MGQKSDFATLEKVKSSYAIHQMFISLIHSSQFVEYACYTTGSYKAWDILSISLFEWLNSSHLLYSPVNLNYVSIQLSC